MAEFYAACHDVLDFADSWAGPTAWLYGQAEGQWKSDL